MKRTILFTSLLAVSMLPLHAQFGLGKLKKAVDTATKLSDLNITEEDEIALGEAISKKVCAAYGVQRDEAATRYVSLVGLAVAAHTDRPKLPYRFIILDSDAVNAFAAPGGIIHITRGALAAMKDEAELAGVLGHEIGHATLKHTVNGIKKQKGIELAEGQTSLSGNAAVLDKVADKMTDAILAGFGRKEELEADEVGVQYAFDTGYDATGLPRFLEVLKARNAGAKSRSGLFASHPETQERIDKLTAQIEKGSMTSAQPNTLASRFSGSIHYASSKYNLDNAGQLASGEKQQRAEVTGSGAARGLGDEGGSADAKKETKTEEPKKKSRFGLGSLTKPLSSGDKEERAEVTGSGAARGLGDEGAPADEKKTEAKKTEEKKAEEKPEKKSRFGLGSLTKPFSSGEKEERAEVTGSGAARGLGDEGADAKADGKQPEKSKYALADAKQPLASGDKQETAQVTGSGAARGLGDEGGSGAGQKNPNPLEVKISAKELAKFKADGKLK